MENENKEGVNTPEGNQVIEPTPEEKAKLLAEISALRAEKNRLDVLIKEKGEAAIAPPTPPTPNKEPKITQDDFGVRYRREQLEKAMSRFKTEYSPTDEEFVKVQETFKRLDSGAIDADFIIRDIVAAYGSVNAEKFVEIKRDKEREEAGAAAFNASGAGSFSGEGGTSSKIQISRDAQVLTAVAKKTKTSEGIQVNLTPEEAESYVSKGTVRELGV